MGGGGNKRKKQRLGGGSSSSAIHDGEDKPFEVLVIQTVVAEAKRIEIEQHAVVDTFVQKRPKLNALRRSILNPQELLVEIPSQILDANKDYLNGSYFKKRDDFVQSLLGPKDKVKDVRLVACIPEGTFPLRKLGPTVCNFKGKGATNPSLPTPKHNARILEDCLRLKHENMITEATKRCPELTNGFHLLRVWFQHHQPSDMVGAFPILVLKLFLADLVLSTNEGAIWAKADCSQLFKRAIRWIMEHDLAGDAEGWASRKVARLGQGIHTIDGFTDNDFMHAFPVIVVDSTGTLNLAHSTLASTYRLLRAQATATIKQQDDEIIFTSRVSSWERFDRLIRIKMPPLPAKDSDHYSAEEEANALHEGTWSEFVCSKLDSLMFRGLMETQRVKHFGLCHPSVDSVVLGLCLDPEKAFRLVDRGPAAEDLVAAGHFRALWGDRAELRRFKDGSIVEAVVWAESEKRIIPELIVDHLLRNHVPFSRIAYNPTITMYSSPISQALESSFDDDSATRDCLKVFTRIEKRIRVATGLPLQVVDVVLAKATGLRYTGFLPEKHFMAFGTRDTRSRKEALAMAKRSVTRCVPIVGDIYVKFEGTSRWPDDLEARKKLECALLAELARSIEQEQLKKVDVDQDEEEAFFADCFVSTDNYMDVLTNGYAFRLQTMMQATRGKEQAVRLQTLLHSLHHRADLSASRSFGQVARLVKQWISGQRFASVVSDDFVDLLVASLFTTSFPMDPPRGALCGLLRFFDLLSHFDFSDRPLLVDLVEYRSPSGDVKAEADKRFFQQKNSGAVPPITIYVRTKEKDEATFFEPWLDEGTTLTEQSLGMLIDRARASKLFLETLCEREATESGAISKQMWKAIFNSDPQQDFDAVISLGDASKLHGTGPKEMAQYQNLLFAASRQALVGFNLVDSLLSELRLKFCHQAEFFVGSQTVPPSSVSSVSSIGVVWKQKRSAFSFKISTARYAKPATASQHEATNEGAGVKLEVNHQELLDEMCRIGSGYIIAAHATSSKHAVA